MPRINLGLPSAQITTRIPLPLRQRLAAHAVATRTPIARIVTAALAQHLGEDRA